MRRDDLADDERIWAESTAGKVEEPFDDNDDDLLSECVVRAPNGDTDLDFGDDLSYFQEARDVGIHVNDLTAVFVDGVGHRGGFLAIAVCGVADELNDFVKRMFVVVPDDDRVLILLHGVRGRLKAKVCFVRRHARFVWRAVECFEEKVQRISDSAAHVLPKFWGKGGTEGVMRDGRDVDVGDGPRLDSWSCVRSGRGAIGVVEEWMEGTVNVLAPCFSITTVTAATRLLSDEEADVVIPVRAGTEAAATQNACFVESAISERRG